MTDFFLFARLNLPNVLRSVAKKSFRHQKQETGTNCDVNSGLQASRKTDFSVIFLFRANQFAKKWYNSGLFMRK